VCVRLTQHQFVPPPTERVPEHADGIQEDVRIAAFCLTSAGPIEVPHGAICNEAIG